MLMQNSVSQDDRWLGNKTYNKITVDTFIFFPPKIDTEEAKNLGLLSE